MPDNDSEGEESEAEYKRGVKTYSSFRTLLPASPP
jgi:hypothetical protein